MTKKERIISFIWQHILLLISLWVMTLGIAFCVRSKLGSSVISTLPYVFEQAGTEGCGVPAWTIGGYTMVINALFVFLQICILRRHFEPVQLFQLVLGCIFGSLIDVNMWITSWLLPEALWEKALSQLAGCIILGTGIAMEVRCGSITMPGEGMPIAVSRVTGIEFPKAKIIVDCTLVVLAVTFGFIFFGSWQWHIVGFGTLFAMVFVGTVVKIVGKHLGFFERILTYHPGFRRYVYGLRRFIIRN